MSKSRGFLFLVALFLWSTGSGPRLESVAWAEDAKTYTCPMHPEVKTHVPGECPICHMKLVPRQTAPQQNEASSNQAGKKIKFYRNPMNPVVTSPVPTKDSMGMDYLPVYGSDVSSAKDSPPGRAAFELSNSQFENLKIETTKVERKSLAENLAISARVSSPSALSLQVLEADLTKIKVGQALEFRTLGSNSSYKGKITGVDTALDPMSRTLRAMALISTLGSPLRLEQSGVATVKVDLGEGLSVPEEAVLRNGQESLVYVVEGKKITPRLVKLGPKVGTSYQVLEGLRQGEEISRGPNFLLDSEARIRGIHD